jgi:hypothetical protein
VSRKLNLPACLVPGARLRPVAGTTVPGMTSESDQLPASDKAGTGSAAPLKTTITEDIYAAPDESLVELTHLVNSSAGALSLGVTLHVSGSIVSGDLISGRVYFQELDRRIQDAHVDPEAAETLAALAQYGTALADRYPAEAFESDPAHEPDRVIYIHLRNATIYAAGISPTFPLWRGRLTQVSAWSWGILML